jgi:hypothetical protein
VQELIDEYEACEKPDYIDWGGKKQVAGSSTS